MSHLILGILVLSNHKASLSQISYGAPLFVGASIGYEVTLIRVTTRRAAT